GGSGSILHSERTGVDGAPVRAAARFISKKVMKHLCRSFLLFIGFVMPLARAGWADVTVTLENPAPNQKVSGIGRISGWAVSSVPGAHVSVSVSIDGQAPISIPCCADRADVARDHGPQALNSGFGKVFNFNILPGTTHSIKVTASDDHGGSASSA